jgi:endonuclease/exonuclease/phosphatase family metal-dependent hydrolase
MILAAVGAAIAAPAAAHAQSAPATFKVAYYNIQSGKGEPALPGRATPFTDTANCTDTSQPLNAWGTGFVQKHLIESIKNDPKVVALALGESWPSVCGSPENIRKLLEWKSRSSPWTGNGVAMVAKYGFASPEEWVQLDTSLNLNPADTMWVLRAEVCLDAACAQTVEVFTAHWYGSGTYKDTSFERQAKATVEFLARAGGSKPYVFTGDLNLWEGVRTCGQDPVTAGLGTLRAAGYIDAWPRLNGSAEGYTGMTNRSGCGSPEGYSWKRIDYTWAAPHFMPVSMTRFGVVPAGDPAPSDHYGIITEFPMPGTTVPPPPQEEPDETESGAGNPDGPVGDGTEIVLYVKNATKIAGNWKVTSDTEAAGGARMWLPDAGLPKLAAASPTPADYFELTFDAKAGIPYRIWMRGRADRDYWGNDSAFVQFSGAVNASGSPLFRIGTTAATWLGIEDCSGCALRGWGWQDNGYGAGVLGEIVYFAASGPQTIRIQRREDGLSIDQIVLSSKTYLTKAPGALNSDATILALPTAPSGPVDIVLMPAASATRAGKWIVETDAAAAGGAVVRHPDAGAAKVTVAAAQPANYFEMTFDAIAGVPYRLWIHGRADRDYWGNDSVFVQFSGTINASSKAAIYRIGTTSAAEVNLEDCASCGISGWMWQDNGYGRGVLGPQVIFEQTGRQTLRVQTREDGLRVDQILLSPGTYLTTAPSGTVTAGTSKTGSETAMPEPLAAPVVADPVTGPVTLRVLQWNLHHGVGTDGKYDIERIANWIVKMTPDVVMLNEVEKFTGWGNEDQPARYEAMLEAKTGKQWYSHFIQEYGNWTGNGKGHQILSIYPLDATDQTLISYSRVIGEATITVNGRLLTLMSTHFDPSSQEYRLTQAKETISWALSRPENRIIAGDLNAWPDQTSIAEMNKTYVDSWAAAAAMNKATSFAGNSPFGATKNGRIDYIYYSKGAADLTVINSHVFDSRDASGVMPSDHRPLVTTFEVR